MNTSKIQRLPNDLVQKIAAAEIVQRPASIVKELLENAIDAHSKTIKLVIQEGGKQLIQVIDDGEGMDEQDAIQCFERYATSKIATIDDLFHIKTLGFRGEALASIAAVAQVELITKTPTQELGTKVIMQGGVLKSKTPVPAPQGTQVTVKNIFFNIPARRNFLKAASTEAKYVIETFQRAAISHPNIAFSLWQNDHLLYHLLPAKPIQRIVHLFGEHYHKHLIPCQETIATVTLSGYIGTPSQSKKTRGGQFIFVNNRYVKSPFIQHAIKKAFEGLILPNTFPFYILNLTVSPESIDVHVHPMKTEVKFEEENLIYTLVSSAIKKALAIHHIIPSIDFDTNVNENPFTFPQQPTQSSSTPHTPENEYTQFKNTLSQTLTPTDDTPPTPTQNTLLTIESDANYSIKNADTTEDILTQDRNKPFLYLHHTYMVTSIKSGILVVDIQAAYERIFYERYTKYLIHQPNAVQKLLFPVKTTVDPADFALLHSCKSDIEKLGFRIELNPPDTVTFTAQPTEAKDQDLQQLLEELLEQYKATNRLETNSTQEAWAKSLAKRIATDQRQKKLASHEMSNLVDQLFACQTPQYTPDGRKTWHVISMEAFAYFLLEQD